MNKRENSGYHQSSKVIDRTKFTNSWYDPGPLWKRLLWYYVSLIFFESAWFPFYKFKTLLLRIFGAKVGKSLGIKPSVKIKYPWHLEIGNYVSIGEEVWIDNLAKVILNDKVTISQGALLITGNHDYKSESFDLKIEEIRIGVGAWICAKAIVGPGVSIGRNSILSLASVTYGDLKAEGIYAGHPAIFVKPRVIT